MSVMISDRKGRGRTCELRGEGMVGEEARVQVAQRWPRRDPVYRVPEIMSSTISFCQQNDF